MRNPVGLLAIIVCILVNPLPAQYQSGNRVSYSHANTYSSKTFLPRMSINSQGLYWDSVTADMRSVLLSPLQWDSGEWMRFSMIMGAAGVLYANDVALLKGMSELWDHDSYGISYWAEKFGNKNVLLPALALTYTGGLIGDNSKLRNTVLLSLKSWGTANLVTALLKRSSGRLRPYMNVGPRVWTGENNQGYRQSFPSGHTTYAWSVATVFATEYADQRWVPPLCYGLATLTGLGRMEGDLHWASDVLIGAAIGYYVGKSVSTLNRNHLWKSVNIVPQINTSGMSLGLSYDF